MVLLIGYGISEILAASVHSGWDEGRMENELPLKTAFDSTKILKEVSFHKCQPLMSLLTD